MPLVPTAFVAPSGIGIGVVGGTAPFTRAGQLPGQANVSAVSTTIPMPTIRVNNGTPISLGTGEPDSYWISTGRDSFGVFAPSATYIYFAPAGMPKINPGDDVVISWRDGWATWTLGPAVAVADAPVLNLADSTLFPDFTDPATMKVGFNAATQSSYNLNFHHNDLMHIAAEFPGDGSVTSAAYSGFYERINQSPTIYGDSKTGPNAPVGDWDFWWNGASDALPFAFGGSCIERAPATITGNINNCRRLTLGGDTTHHGADVFSWVYALPGSIADGRGLFPYDFTNPRLLPAGTDPDNGPLHRPNILTRFNGGTAPQSIRFLDPGGANGGNAADYEDFENPSRSRGSVLRTINANIARIEPYTGTTPLLDPTQGLRLKITTTGPHGLRKGQLASIFAYSGNPGLPLSDGSTVNLDGHRIVIYPLTEDTLAAFDVSYPGHASTLDVAGAVTPTAPQAFITMTVTNAMPFSDMVKLCNDANCDLYFPTCSSATDDALIQLATYAAINLNPGLKFRVEPFNEVWNGLEPAWYLSQQSYEMVGANLGFPFPAYVMIGSHHHTIMRNAWIDAGRDPADFVRLFGTQQGTTQVTAWLIQELVRQDAPTGPRDIDFEELVFGSYMFNSIFAGVGPETSRVALIERLPVAAHVDLLEINHTLGGHEQLPHLHMDVLQGKQSDGSLLHTRYANVRPAVYEGGPDFLAVQGSGTLDYQALSRAVVRHPRWWGILQHHFRIRQDAGCSVFHVFLSGDVDRPYSQWSAYQHTAQLPYQPGDPDQDAIQIATPDRIDLVRSVTGGAVIAWQGRVSGTTTTPTPNFSLSIDAPVTLAPGSSANATARMHPANNYTGTADLTTLGTPPGVTATPSPASLTGGATLTSSIAVAASSSATPGTSTVTVRAHDAAGNLTHSASLVINVTGQTTTPPPTTGQTIRYLAARRLGRRRA